MAIRKLKTCLALLAVSGVLAAAAEEAPKNLLMNSDFQTATQPGFLGRRQRMAAGDACPAGRRFHSGDQNPAAYGKK